MKKYGYPGGGEQFEKDVQAKMDRIDALYEEFVKWMIAHDVEPETARLMFVKFYFDMVDIGRSEKS